MPIYSPPSGKAKPMKHETVNTAPKKRASTRFISNGSKGKRK